MLPNDLSSTWRRLATVLREHEVTSVALTYEKCADALEEALHERDAAPLTIRQAAAESGYSEDHLSRLIREGTIPNAGRPNAPRIARADLPLKPGGGVSSVPPEEKCRETTNAAVVQSIIEQGVG